MVWGAGGPAHKCTLKPTDYIDIGIFNDCDEYEQFISKCKTCKNYKNGNCKALSEFMEYKITKNFDISTRQCTKFKLAKVK